VALGDGVATEAARIAAELRGPGAGIDPFAAAVRATRMPMIVTDPRQPDNPVVFANDAFCRLTGYRRDEILGRNCRFLQGHGTDPATVAKIRAAVAARTSIEIDIRNYRKDGEPFWNRLLMAPVRDASGEVAYFFASQVDVTIERERLALLESHNAALMAEVADQRRRAERRIQLSEESLRLATEAGEIGTWDWDLVTRDLTCSERTRAMFGIGDAAPVTMVDFFGCVHPDDRAATSAAFRSSYDPAIRATYEAEFRAIGRDDGVIRWVAARGRGLFEDEVCRRSVGTALDITARKTAHIRAQFQSDLWDRMRESSDARAITDIAVRALGEQLMANRVGYGQVMPDDATVVLETCFVDGVAPLTGVFPLDGFGGHNVARQRRGLTVAHDDVTLDPNNDAATWAAIETRAFVSVPLVRDGRFRASLFVNSRAVRIWSGEDIALIETVAGRLWDALERARAETALRDANDSLERLVAERTAELRANQATLRTIFETSNQLQGLLALDGTLLDANAAWLAAIDARLDAVVGQKFWDTPWFAATPSAPEMVREAVAAAAAGTPWRQEITVRLPSGPRSYDFAMRPIFDAGGTAIAIVPDAVDITERRQAEAALRQAQKMEAVGQLTGGIAHDFNNLLTGITGSLELVRSRIVAGRTADLDRFAVAAMNSARRAAALTQRLLAFARRQPLDPKRVDVNRLVSGMEELLRRTLGPGVALEMVLAGGLWPTLCDPNQLESAILNLAINARDAMPDGGKLTIETVNARLDAAYANAQGDAVRPGQYVSLAVTDTGTGMPPDVTARAFDPFFTTKPTGQGTGLGLSMLYGFVKQSNGHVRIYSEVGQGTCFKVYLPRLQGQAAEQAREAAETALASLRSEAGERVLVVDDEASVRLLIVETLEDLGYTAMEAADGTTALRILQTDVRIDLLVTDVGLPGLNGRQLADAARVARPDLRVLFVTGYAHNAAIGDGGVLEAGMQIITKPFTLDALAGKIRGMIEAA
jgi:PAS domain S-box-containing protein